MTGLQLRKALASNQKVFGTLLVSRQPKFFEQVANIDIDFVFLDTEHIPMDRENLSMACQYFNKAGIAPIVRIPFPDKNYANMYVDGGACGIIVPYVENPQQIQDLIGSLRFRPLKGEKLQRVMADGDVLGTKEKEYLENFNEHVSILINIESVAGMENLPQILETCKIDGIVIGPHDLSVSLGIPEQYFHEAFRKAVSQIVKTAKAYQIGVGIHYSYSLKQELSWLEEGMNVIIHSSDMMLFCEKLQDDLHVLKSVK